MKLKNSRKNICKILFAICLIISCISADCRIVYANDNNSNTAKSGAEKSYQAFLDGKRRLYIEDDILEMLSELQYGSELESLCQTGVYMEDILKQLNPVYMEYEDDPRISHIEYTYLDCGNDGSKELAVKFDASTLVNDTQIVFIIVYENGKLYLRHAYETWVRNRTDLDYYGYMKREGSGGLSGDYEEAYLDKSGRKMTVYIWDYYLDTIDDEELCREYDDDTDQVKLLCWEYMIRDQTYLCFPDLDPVENAKFYELYEQKYEKLYTVEQLDELIAKRKTELKLNQKLPETKEPDWTVLENTSYRQYVRTTDLMESRKEQKKESNSVLKEKWVSCEQENFYDTSKIDLGFFEFSYTWRSTLNYILSDYSQKANIPDSEWSLQKLVSYGDKLYAFTVQGEDNREICFLMSSQAIYFDLAEYTEYIMAVDFQFNAEGNVPWHNMSYDSMLDWESYKQTDYHSELLYTVYGDEDGLYNFESESSYAMNQYLTNQHADTSDEWKLDINTVCPIGQGRMVIYRYTCKEQEIVMILDDANKTFAIIKGLGE